MSRDVRTIRALREGLALQIARHVARSGRTQADAAARLGLPQPTLSRIANGRVETLSLELLLRATVRAGLPVVLQTGRDPVEAGVYVTGPPAGERRQPSPVGDAARRGAADALTDLSPEQRLEAQLKHSRLLAELRNAAHVADARQGRPSRSSAR